MPYYTANCQKPTAKGYPMRVKSCVTSVTTYLLWLKLVKIFEDISNEE